MYKEECKSLDFDIVIKKENSLTITDGDYRIVQSSIEKLEHLHITKTHILPTLKPQSDDSTADFHSVLITIIILSPAVPILLYIFYKFTTYLSLQQYLITRYNHLTTLTLQESPPPILITEQELSNLSRRIDQASLIAVETQLTYDLKDITLPINITSYEIQLKAAFNNYYAHFSTIYSSSSFSKTQYCVDNLPILKHIHNNRVQINDIIGNIQYNILHSYKDRAYINSKWLNRINRAYQLCTAATHTCTRGLSDDDSEV